MMAVTFSSKPAEGGVMLTGVVSNEELITIPESIEGFPVVSIAERSFRNLKGAGTHTIIIPSTVTRSEPDALDLSVNIRHIVYRGSFDTFNAFEWYSECECMVECEDFTFTFPAGHHLSFPLFDEEMLASDMNGFDAVALKRLSKPRYLSDDCRTRYLDRMRKRSMRLAQHAVTSNDPDSLIGIFNADILSDDDLQEILELSLSSGKVAVTSTVMSEINRRFHISARSADPCRSGRP